MAEGERRVREKQVREAMDELERYLSDSIAPLLAADSLELLTRCPPNLVAMQCESWARQQFQAHGGSVRISNLFFHAFKKIHVVAELGLIASDVMDGFLNRLRGLLVEACPAGEQEVLRQNLDHVGSSGAPVSRRVDLLFTGADGTAAAGSVLAGLKPSPAPPVTAGAPVVASGVGANAAVDMSHQLRQFGILLERLTQQAGVSVGEGEPMGGAVSSALQRQLIAAAVESATSKEDLLEHLDQVSARSHQKLDLSAAIRELSQDLPDWALRGEGGTAKYQGATAAAIDKIVALTDDAEEAAGRFWELINSAVEQVNDRAVARAVTLLDLAEKLAASPNLDQRRIRASRRSAAGAIEDEALRELAARPESRQDLRRVLEFFPEWSPEGLLDQLDAEPIRIRRHLCLSLLEVHGPSARALCLDRLEESLATAAHDAWMWQRNLVHVLRRVSVDQREEREFRALEQTSELDLPPQLVRESVTALASSRSNEATPILVDRLQRLLSGRDIGAWVGEEKLKLRGELALALAQIGTDDAWGWLVSLALEPQAGLMNLDLLDPLAESDLSNNPDLVDTLFATLEALLPVKVLGVALPATVATLRNRKGTVHIVRALTGTRSGAVADRLQALAGEYANSELGSIALRTAAAIRNAEIAPPGSTFSRVRDLPVPESAPKRAEVESVGGPGRSRGPDVVFEGDLEVFRLPDLLQSLVQLGIDGRLELRDTRERLVSRIGVRDRRIVEAAVGRLSGPPAIYEILQAPFLGSFTFVRYSGWPKDLESFDVMGLMMEGMRRFDEFKRMVALVPDDAILASTGSRPTPLTDDDASILRPIWQGANAGKTARQIERSVPIDRFRVRSLLAHWVEEGALQLV